MHARLLQVGTEVLARHADLSSNRNHSSSSAAVLVFITASLSAAACITTHCAACECTSGCDFVTGLGGCMLDTWNRDSLWHKGTFVPLLSFPLLL